MSGEYKDFPVSMGELRASRSDSPNDWEPRDVLVSLLRDLDSGKISPRHIVVCFSEEKDDGLADNWVQAGKANAHEQIGMLQSAVQSMWHNK